MADSLQKDKKTSPDISPLGQDPTYGERMYSRVFDFGINFLANLTLSAGFNYWVNHSLKPIKLFGKQFSRPGEVQGALTDWIERRGIMKVFSDKPFSAELGSPRRITANTMSGVATLTAAGHIIMIPSVWLGAKIKPWFVEYFDRKHYGEASVTDPTLVARHAAIANAERPTLFGAIIGRLGTIVATQTTAYTIGGPINLIQGIGKLTGLKGLRGYKGLDHTLEFFGDRFGGVVSETLGEARTSRINDALIRRKYGWGLTQVDKRPELASSPYGRLPDGGGTSGFNEHYGKYVVSDIMYTIVTSLSINPAINFLKHYIPGVTYKPKQMRVVPEHLADDVEKIHIKPNPIAPTFGIRTPSDSATATDQPEKQIQKREHHDRVESQALSRETGS